MCSCIGMATAFALTRLARVDSPSLSFNPPSSRSLSEPRAFLDMQGRRITPATTFRGGRTCPPFLFTSSYSHFSERLFSIPKAAPRLTSTTTDQTSGSEGRISRRAFQVSMPPALQMVLAIIGFMLRVAGPLFGFLRKEERVLNEIEDDIDEVADFVKVAAEGIEQVAKGIENVSEVIEKDAETVVTVIDKVKAETKTVHDELDNAIGTLDGSFQVVQAKVAEAKNVASEVKVKAARVQTEREEVKQKAVVGDSSTVVE